MDYDLAKNPDNLEKRGLSAEAAGGVQLVIDKMTIGHV
jgi:uncharacterized DUF497 family protein